jgi:PAS domain-containing protein
MRIGGVPLASMSMAAAAAGLALLAVGLSEVLADHQRALRVRDLGQAIAQSEEKLREQHRLLDTALNNMSQALVMFDAEARMVVCNRRYIEMYGLSPDVVKPGCTLKQLLEHRVAMGSFSGDPAEYVEMLRAAIAQGHTTDRTLELDDGRVIVVVNQPMAGGG